MVYECLGIADDHIFWISRTGWCYLSFLWRLLPGDRISISILGIPGTVPISIEKDFGSKHHVDDRKLAGSECLFPVRVLPFDQ